ncbi:MAG: NAD(P) transhydrogenase subunit alpha [Saprospiraceae bacterium]|nr:NAD(P) transhydrogenase subunit alpha [Saprospiraceae bacterium]
MIGVLNETCRRVALSPAVCKKIKDQLGMDVLIEKGAGKTAGYIDAAYQDVARVVERNTVLEESNILVSVNPLSSHDYALAKKGVIALSMFEPYNSTGIASGLKEAQVQAFSLDMIPRSTLAQAVDILSSMASLAGYKAVLLGASENSRCLPMMMTAAGTIKPANVLIIGAGVAGLQAIATAKRLGAKVSAFDVRSSSKEEVQSLGAKFVEVEGAKDDSAAGGYAIQQSEEFLQRQKEEIHKYASKSDIIITTAQLRGKKAPILVEDRTIAAMTPGSVIVDLAAKTGGNTAFTKEGKVVTDNGIIIIGDSDLADSIPEHSSDLIASNYFNFLKLFVKDGQINIDMSNPILDASLITK